MREVTLFKGFTFNPVVTIGAAVMLWGFVIKVSVDQEGSMESFGEWKSWVTQSFTWLYIGSQDYWLLFLAPLCYYYGHVKLGRDDEEPEYSDMSYFCMVFCSGVAIGLIFYGASEPLWHMLSSTGANRYNNNGYSNDNQRAQDAINVTLFHWGLQAWVVYALTAVSMGFLSYRKGLPLCFRTTLAPLFGKATWGWFGDLIDIVTIVTIVAGLCTSLGLGAKQIVAGLQRLEWLDGDLDEKGLANAASVAIVIITGCATLSVVSGLNYGIKTLSQTAFILGNFLLCTVFFLDAPWYLLNVMVQSLGYHLQNFIEIGFFTDAFAQLQVGEGRPNDGKGADPAWMDWWTIFYWGWWIAWAPFVGTFLARISRGRTIANVVAYSLTVPFFYALVWFCTFGAAAIRMHRRAEFLSEVGGDLFLATNQDFRPTGAGKCFDVPSSLPAAYAANFSSYVTNAHLSPVCLFSWSDDAGYWFDLMYQFHGMGPFLSGVSILVIVLFFVTSSDSGSLVVDLIAANGREAHVIQRIFWAVSEGAVAVALLQAGGTQSLKALQAISIVAGLPFTVILMFMCTAIWRALKIDQGHMQPRTSRVDWALPLYGGIFELFETVLSMGRSGLPEASAVVGFLLGIFAPPLLLHRSVRGLAGKRAACGAKGGLPSSNLQDTFLVVASGLLYLAFWVLHILALARVNRGLSGMGWAALVAFVSIVAVCRHSIRLSYHIEGSGMEDFFVCLLFWPQALVQMAKQVTLEIETAGDVKAKIPDGKAVIVDL
jgi:choline-glycine betaine transporter